jgi:hypothetical protein
MSALSEQERQIVMAFLIKILTKAEKYREVQLEKYRSLR